MKKMYVLSTVVMLLLTGLLIIVPMGETAQAATLTVGSDQTYTTIQGAIDAASPGDIIRINDGVYNEHLTISVPLTIIGNGTEETQIITDSSAPAISVQASYVNISNMAVSTQGRASSQYGIEIVGGNNYTTLTNLYVFDNYYGVRSRGSSSSVHNDHTVIDNCVFEQNYYGVYLYYADHTEVTESTFTGNYYSIYV